MLRYAVRRVLWSIPTLLATSLVLFLVTTLAAEPTGSLSDSFGNADVEQLLHARRERFLDLPRFFNPHPEDVRTRALDALGHVAAADSANGRAAKELVRLGGAALPYVLPQLEALPPEARRRVALALAPVAERMRLSSEQSLSEPEAAVLFWTRFWDDRALDFTRPGVTRAVTRLVEHTSTIREHDLVAMDTFALPALIRAMATCNEQATLAQLMAIARHVAQRGPVVRPQSSPTEVRRATADWTEWWFVYANDFTPLDGAEGIVASITDTRYGKWLKRIGSGQLGVSLIDGEPILAKLLARAPLTLSLCLLSLLVSFALAVPVGAIGAWWRGRPFDVVASAGMFLLYATPTFFLAELLRRAAASTGLQVADGALAVCALAAGSLATLSRWQRSALLEVKNQDFVRTAQAKGLSPWRVLIVHVLRNALMPTITVAGLHLPALFAGAVVVEEIFGLPGIGFETLRAIENRDSAWLMAALLLSAVTITLGLVASDVAYGAIDPRVRERLDAQGRPRP
jgi:ABC-type dipeptide/oligopeptide/nickel transport system permease component